MLIRFIVSTYLTLYMLSEYLTTSNVHLLSSRSVCLNGLDYIVCVLQELNKYAFERTWWHYMCICYCVCSQWVQVKAWAQCMSLRSMCSNELEDVECVLAIVSTHNKCKQKLDHSTLAWLDNIKYILTIVHVHDEYKQTLDCSPRAQQVGIRRDFITSTLSLRRMKTPYVLTKCLGSKHNIPICFSCCCCYTCCCTYI